MILEDEDDDATDMNKEPLFVHVYPGSRVLEMALPYESMKMKQIDAMIRSTQPPVIQEKESKSLLLVVLVFMPEVLLKRGME